MFSSTIIRAVAVLIAVTSAVAHGGPDAGPAAPRPSNTSCTFSCPKQDVGRYNSHAPSCGNEDQGLVCSFPSKDPGAHGFNRQFTCTYNPSTGKLVEDRNSGYCPKTAEQECRSRRDETAALHDEPSVAIPENMKARHVIQKRHLNRL